MTKTAMKAYMDKNDRLIIIIDQPGAGLTELVKSFLGGNIPEVQHLDAPAPMPTPEIDTTGMKEVAPSQQAAKPAKFIRNKETEEAAPNGSAPESQAAPKPPAAPKPDKKRGRKAADADMKNSASSPESDAKPGMNVQLIECMTVFELQDYLRSRSSDQKLVAILAEQVHAPLDFVLNTKSEREIRAIAQKLAN